MPSLLNLIRKKEMIWRNQAEHSACPTLLENNTPPSRSLPNQVRRSVAAAGEKPVMRVAKIPMWRHHLVICPLNMDSRVTSCFMLLNSS
jgi:hypothetical protein